jgi:acyl carrier protein
VDRRALARIEPERSVSGFVAPRTPTEELLAGIWSDLLQVERVGANDRFFDLGGHSLLAARLTSRVRDTFGVELPVRTVFEAPALADLASRIDQSGDAPRLPVIVPRPHGGEAPLSFAQERLWFLEKLQPGSSAYDMPMAVRLRGRLDVEALEAALLAVARRHETLRTTFAGPCR